MPNLLSLYSQKDSSYFASASEHLSPLIDRSGLTVLEVGCGAGMAGNELLRAGKARWVTGIELMDEQGKVARSLLNEVCIGDIEEMAFHWIPGYFDCFIFGDVLEHVKDPWKLLERLRPLLADDGFAVASLPNVKHWPVIANLIFHDDWPYVESGVLDITHLRFFTRKSSIRMFSETGYSVETIRPYFNGRRYSILHQITFGALAGFLAQRWLLKLKAA